MSEPRKIHVMATEFENYQVTLRSDTGPAQAVKVIGPSGKVEKIEALPGSWLEMQPKPSRADLIL